MMSQREDALKFETGRIKALQEERLHIQKKTFTKWMNSFLIKSRMEVEDLFTDLADGRMLLKLLEIISGEKLGKPNSGRMRVHKIENVNKSLAFLHTKVRLESIGAEDIVDGNPRLILGLIWTIILRFQIQEIEIDVDEENESSEKKSAKDALLLWCQRKTKGYANVNIQDFTGSWRSGLGFNALIHAHRPDLIEFEKLVATKHIDNLNNAFDVAEAGLGIPRLLDAEDIDTSRPDEKSILTYVASYYHTFAQMYNKDKSGRRIHNIISQIKEADDLKSKYELDGKSLLTWIKQTTVTLNSRDFPNNLEGVQKLLIQFKTHITNVKPPKYNEKSEIEANYFIINTRLKELNQATYVPPEGLLVHDIERGWEEMEKSEYLRESALREEIIRQTNLEQLSIRFDKKSLLREGYLKDMIQVLSDPRYGINLAQVEATLKKHEAISADILAREQRCEQLVNMADYLVKERYHDAERVKKRASEIMRTWDELIKLLDGHKANLEKFSCLMMMIRDIDAISSSIRELEGEFSGGDLGVHLAGVEDLLQSHSLVESQISSMGESIKRIGRVVGAYNEGDGVIGVKEIEMVRGKLAALNNEYSKLVDDAKLRRWKLEDSKSYYQFVNDHEIEEGWVAEKRVGFVGPIVCKDLRGVEKLIVNHRMVVDEVRGRSGAVAKVSERGIELVRVWEQESSGSKKVEIADVKSRVESLEAKWEELKGLGSERGERLHVVSGVFQFYSDANEMDSWIEEKRPLVSSSDYGSDEPSAAALLRRHLNLEEEIIAYNSDVKGLSSEGGRLVALGIQSIEELSMTSDAAPVAAAMATDEVVEYVMENKMVPEEYFEDEVVEKMDYKTVTEERAVAQVKGLYGFQGQDVEIKKGEVMFLLNKTNSDWWNVRKANGEDGFVPANYVKEIEPKVVVVQVRKPEVVKETRKVKKTRMVMQSVKKPVKRQAPKIPPTQSQSSASPSQPTSELNKSSAPAEEPIQTRTTKINNSYEDILKLSSLRKQNLQESIKLFQFLRECDDFEKWINEKLKYLSSSNDSNSGNMESVQVAKRSFEKFLTDLSASNKRVNEIESMVKGFEGSPAVAGKVNGRYRDVKQKYNELLRMKALKEKGLEGALSVELFYRSCEEVNDWISEKFMQVEMEGVRFDDLKTVQALQRKHLNLERELAPIKEKVDRVEDLAASVKSAYPEESENVDERKRDVVKKWDDLVRKADERKASLSNAVGMQIFVQGVKGLEGWGDGVVDKMNGYVGCTDVSSAEGAVKKHLELGDEIKGRVGEFQELRGLGEGIRDGGSSVENVTEKLRVLNDLEARIGELYAEKSDWLSQVLDLQVFLREADHIDSATRNHVQFLKDGRVGKDLDEVEMLIKRMGDFENTLVAQDERLKGFVAMGDKLCEAGHFESDAIKERVKGVVKRKEEVKSLAKTHKDKLNRSLRYHEFNNDVIETITWVNEKMRIAKDESYKDLSNVNKKLKKHEAFAGELRANEVRIKNINRSGEKLVSIVPEKAKEIKESVAKLNKGWDELVALSAEKLEGLRQAEAQANFNKDLEAVVERVAGIEGKLRSGDSSDDRRSCKDAIKNANGVDQELGAVSDKLRDLEAVVKGMEDEGHFDSTGSRGRVDDLKERVGKLVSPVGDLKSKLDEKYAFYDFLHELEGEELWIREKRGIVDGDVVGVADLYQAQSVVKKHKKVESEVWGREPLINKIVEKSERISGGEVRERVDKFKKSYDELKTACKSKMRRLDLTLKAQQFFFDAGEIESWMNEKEDALRSRDYGDNVHAAVKLLTKHKTIELEMDSYNGLVVEMRNLANGMVNTKHPDSVLIAARIQSVEDHMGVLRKLGGERRGKLISRVALLEYLNEAEEFLGVVEEIFGREVGSAEFGGDYEHLLLLKGRFCEVEVKVDGVNERFKGLEGVAARLVAQGNSGDEEEVSEVERVQGVVREKWNNTLSLMAAREQKLHAAGEIHAFNRDVADALARIQEKLNSIPETVGRDVNSCEGMLRAHEAFENDLLALEAQLQSLVDDASRLSTLYPTNAANIRTEQQIVIESWNNLQTKATLRKEQLQNAVDFWRFSAEYAALTSFLTSLLNTLPSQPKLRDTASSQQLMNEHETIRSEIDARSGQFEKTTQLGVAMVNEMHPESAEVTKMLANIGGLRERVGVAWERKKIYLDQLIDLNIFLRDAKALETACLSQEGSLSAFDSNDGNNIVDVEEADSCVRRFEGFEKIVIGQEEKFRVLETQGIKLVKQDHFESALVNERVAEVKAKRERVMKLLAEKKRAVHLRVGFVRFLRDLDEAKGWVGEKIRKLEHEKGITNSNSSGKVNDLTLQEKIKTLKKHQGFCAEVESNRPRVDELLRRRVEGDQKVLSSSVGELRSKWDELVKLVNEFGKDLEEAHDILEFMKVCEEVEGWVREKEGLVGAGDIGEDYEHCGEIIKRLEDVDSGIRVDDSRVKGLNSLADKLVSVTGDHDGVIEHKRVELNRRWGDLKGGLEAYRGDLERALEVHKYNRDVDEVEERIVEKLGGLRSDGNVSIKDLEHCEGLVRKHEMVEAIVGGIEARVVALETERKRLEGKNKRELKSLEGKWLEVSQACLERRNDLTASLELHRFEKKYLGVKGYFEVVSRKISDIPLGSSVEEAERSEKGLKELWSEVVARETNYNEVVRVGKRAVVESHVYSEVFGERVKELEGLRKDLEDRYVAMGIKVSQSVKMQRLFTRIDEVMREIEFNDAFLNTRELGVESLSAVGVLLRRHGEFSKEFGGLEGKVTALINEGTTLQQTHYDSQSINRRLTELKSKLEKLKSRAQTRSTKLRECYELHKFVLEMHEIENYAVEKLKIANDDNYSDMSNLQSKIQRHEAFESELRVSYGRVRGVEGRCAQIVEAKRRDGDEHEEEEDVLTRFVNEINERVAELSSIWKDLESASALKQSRLQESYQAMLFNQNLEDIEAWMDELESNLESEDHGVDLSNTIALISKWGHLEREFNHKKDVISGVVQTAEGFEKVGHCMAGEIRERVDLISKRYEALQEPLAIRKDNLEETRRFFEFLRDVGEELGWIVERLRGVGDGAEMGATLPQVQLLQKKHNQLESEIISHEPITQSLQTRSTGMIRSNHYASDKIQQQTTQLTTQFQNLKDSASIRRLRLADAYLSQSFYDEANELLSWMLEKSNYCKSIELLDKDSASEHVYLLMKRCEGVKRDVEGLNGRVEKCVRGGEGIVERGHFDEEGVTRKVEEVKGSFSELQKSVDKRMLRLSDGVKFYEFSKSCGEVIDWVQIELMNVAGSEEYGRDVEHVEVLILKFEAFMVGEVQESRVTNISVLADELIQQGHPDVERINGRVGDVKAVWDEFKELASARLEALQGAKQVHAFDRTADETIAWINEKLAVASSEDYGHDLQSIQSLIRQHTTVFESDLKPVESKVSEVRSEANRLRTLFVDASEHIDDKIVSVDGNWDNLVRVSKSRGDRLVEAEKLQGFFDKYAELIVYVNEVVAKVTSFELGRDVRAAELGVQRNAEIKREVHAFKPVVDGFVAEGNGLIKNGHFMSGEIGDKIGVLSNRFEYLNGLIEEKGDLLDKNLDLRVYLGELDELNSWLSGKEPELKELKLGESILEVEELIKHHEEWSHTLEAQEARVEGLRRSTLIERAWEELKRRDEDERRREVERVERERLEANANRLREINNRAAGAGDAAMATKKDGKEKGSFLGSTRFGSFVFGGGSGVDKRRSGSYPSSVDGNHSDHNSSSNLKQISSLTPPGSLTTLNNTNSSYHASQQQEQTPTPLSRSESLRLLNTATTATNETAEKSAKPKRTPSFTTRRRTASFRNKKNNKNAIENLSPVEIEGYLERKHELQAGGKRAAVRSWKHYYVLLCGQVMCFFKDQEDVELSGKVGVSSPIGLGGGARCSVATDYTKRKFVFRVKPADGSEYLFAAESKEVVDEWVKRVNAMANLRVEGEGEGACGGAAGGDTDKSSMMPPPPLPPQHQASSKQPQTYNDSTTDDDDDDRHHHPHHHHQRKPKPRTTAAVASNAPRSREPIYANNHHDDDVVVDHEVQLRNQQQQASAAAAKPPIPPRSSSIILESPTKKGQNGSSLDTVDNQQYFVGVHQQQQRPLSVQSPSSSSPSPSSTLHHSNPHHLLMQPRSTGSLPPNLTSPTKNSSFLHGDAHHNSSNSENEQLHSPAGASMVSTATTGSASSSHETLEQPSGGSKKGKKKSSSQGGHNQGEKEGGGGLMGLFKRKKATQL